MSIISARQKRQKHVHLKRINKASWKKKKVALTSSYKHKHGWALKVERWEQEHAAWAKAQRWECGSSGMPLEHTGDSGMPARKHMETLLSCHIANYLGILLASSKLIAQSPFTNGTFSAAFQRGKPTRVLRGVFGVNNNQTGGGGLSSRIRSPDTFFIFIMFCDSTASHRKSPEETLQLINY